MALGLGGVVAGLVNRRTGCGIGRSSLQDVGNSDRGRRLGRMEEGDDVEGFVLSRLGMSASTSRSSHDQSTHESKHLAGIEVRYVHGSKRSADEWMLELTRKWAVGLK